MSKFKVMCVQPVSIDRSIYNELLLLRSRRDKPLDEFIGDKNSFSIDWLVRFTKEYYKFKYYKSLSLDTNKLTITDKLVDDLKELKYQYNQKPLHISDYVDIKKSTFDVVFDIKLFHFIIIYEIHFDIPDKILEDLLLAPQNGLYNYIRSILVSGDDNIPIGLWASLIRNKAIESIRRIVKEVLDNKNIFLGPYSVSIRKNTGNISFFVYDKNLKDSFIKCNIKSELNSKEPIEINELYYFFGRYHTIFVENDIEYYRYARIQYHVQFFWFFSSFYIEALELFNFELTECDNHGINRIELIDKYINNIHMLYMHNESFKLTIEGDNELIFEKISKRWNIQESLSNIKEYSNFLKDYMSRVHDRKQNILNEKQNRILFFISCLQLVSLISVWGDYFNLINKNYVTWVSIISAFLPLIFIIFIAIIFVVYTKNRKC